MDPKKIGVYRRASAFPSCWASSLYLQADRAHQFEGVALLHDAGAEPVVEDQIPGFEMILEMHIRGSGIEGVGDMRERQIMCRDQPYGAPIYKTPHNRFRADSAIVGVRAVQQFVDEEEQRQLSFGQIHEFSQAHDLRIKTRTAALQRVLNPYRC